MHVLGLVVLQPGGDPSAAAETLAKHVGERLGAVPRFRRRAVSTPFELGPPLLVEDENFDVDKHVARATLRTPGDAEALANFVGQVAAQPLDRSQPLWEAWILEGLEGGRIAFATKIHHALIDGSGGVAILGKLFEVSPDGDIDDAYVPVRDSNEGESAILELLGAAASTVASAPSRIYKAGAHTVSSLTRAFRDPALAEADAEELVAKPFTAPRNVLTQAISSERVVGFGRASLPDVLAIKKAVGAKVNDVVLAACTHALREYLLSRNEGVEEPLVATVPVSVEHEGTELGNHVSAMFVYLPVHLEDMQSQIDFIKRSTAAAKQARVQVGDSLLDDWLAAAPGPLVRYGAQLFSFLRLADLVRPAHNLVVSNVMGPSFPLYSAGSLVEACYPLGPVMEGAALNVTVMSYRDHVDLGIVACPRAVPDPASIARGFERSVRAAAERLGA
jgi:WS/DGAT/MGAT family acyltransferase